MFYSIGQLAKLAHVSVRTLHWYEKLGLITSKRKNNGYRTFDATAVKRLQQVLIYRELGFELSKIAILVDAQDLSLIEKLNWQLNTLQKERGRLDRLIANLEQTIETESKGLTMKDEQRFEAFKKDAIKENEDKYGKEIRRKYGDDTVDASNAKFANMTKEQHEQMEQLTKDLAEQLKLAILSGDTRGTEATKLAQMHKRWLMFFWTSYSPEQHRGVSQMYVDDERFKKYYEDIACGGARFLRDAVHAWLDTGLDAGA